jgi:pyruvate dehydrogenase complex dehydrogenase (E1) component
MALARRLGKDPGRIYCLMGDGEVAEGSVWEAAQLAAFYKLSNLCGIVDVNAQGQSGRTMHQHEIPWFRNSKHEIRNSKQILISNDQNSKPFKTFGFKILDLFRISIFGFRIYLRQI